MVRKQLDARRLGAVIIDLLLFAPIEIVAYQYDLGAMVLVAALWLIYFFLCDVLTGQTLGKALLGLRTVTVEGDLPSPRAASARTILRLLDHGIIGLVTLVATGGRRQRLGDLAAGTIVVRSTDVIPLPPTPSRTVWLWPALWLAPALVVFFLSADGRLAGTYRAEADALCAAAMDATVRAGATLDASMINQQLLQQRLAELDVPPNWRDRHDALLAEGDALMVQITAALAKARRAANPERVLVREMQQLQPAAMAANARITRMGYADCGESS